MRQSQIRSFDVETFNYVGKESTLADILRRSRMVLTCGGRRLAYRSPDYTIFPLPHYLTNDPQRRAMLALASDRHSGGLFTLTHHFVDPQ
jgi:hypothetical protein